MAEAPTLTRTSPGWRSGVGTSFTSMRESPANVTVFKRATPRLITNPAIQRRSRRIFTAVGSAKSPHGLRLSVSCKCLPSSLQTAHRERLDELALSEEVEDHDGERGQRGPSENR